ncbi:Holliday junction resolvase RuvX [Corynebacterium felinum]|uniref:Putative pre-16S rRNA nuclease n=1 Tax=Corynebacterium felinum TaxID=131318 RepID=A0ABU2BBM5_9CORY|nr:MULTISPECIES: Holliday junction resolvase RuvX [Corynebacterium]MDF5821932.1 Holliday junction resolvase RuvX [Corynebacterium felinum]MDO4760336.1 Holliday junction resolvase RuvX [Corynebacterium sp.]MDR7355776.1 putative Holliday junction resolvase [Corynebacterium felinum]WJY95122.1 Putative Holliday junction resolvase [Corynebacterium felinum]
MAQIVPDQPGENDPGAGRRLGVDVGTVRIGLALSGSDATLAMPLETVPRKTGFKDSDQEDIDRIVELIAQHSVVEVVVGLPRTLKALDSSSIKHAKEIAFRIRRRCPHIPVKMADERLSTVIAAQALRASGVSEKHGRKVVDQAAAVEILQSWLDGRAVFLSHVNETNQ